jgi:tRNA-modifying protein YgfZ
MTEPFAARVPRDVVVVSGPDATSFLQNLLSQDLDPVAVGQTVPALLLQPQGKLLVMLRAARTSPDSWSCDCDAGSGAVLAEGLNRFKIRVKVDIEQVTGVEMLAVRGADPPDDVEGVRPAPGGWDVVRMPAELDAIAARIGVPAGDADAYDRWRIEAGVPRMGVDVDDRTIPQEAGLELTAVSFTKGCFVGQELVCRIDTRGHVNRHLRRLRGDQTLAAGAEVVADGTAVGTVTTAVGNVALALLRREVQPGATVRAGGVVSVVESL